MKLGSIWYCMTKACSQPAYGWVCGIASSAGQRVATSQAAHHAIASSRLLAPMKNSRRCGVAASRAGDRVASAGSGSGPCVQCRLPVQAAP